MPLTARTLPRHELIGLPVRVAAAAHEGFVGISGEVVMETTRTLSIAAESSRAQPDEREARSASESRAQPDEGSTERVWQVPKADATFEFTLPGDSKRVTVAGERLVARPARRTERTGDSKWR